MQSLARCLKHESQFPHLWNGIKLFFLPREISEIMEQPLSVNIRVDFLGKETPVVNCQVWQELYILHRADIKSIFLCKLSEWMCPSPSSRSKPGNISLAKSTQHVKHLSTILLAPSQAPRPGSCRNSSAYSESPSLSPAPTLKAIQTLGSLCFM